MELSFSFYWNLETLFGFHYIFAIPIASTNVDQMLGILMITNLKTFQSKSQNKRRQTERRK